MNENVLTMILHIERLLSERLFSESFFYVSLSIKIGDI